MDLIEALRVTAAVIVVVALALWAERPGGW